MLSVNPNQTEGVIMTKARSNPIKACSRFISQTSLFDLDLPFRSCIFFVKNIKGFSCALVCLIRFALIALNDTYTRK